VIDRTFIDENNVRWIIDYKTTLSQNMEEEKQKHIKQLRQYTQALQMLDSRPIHCGLYFPLTSFWIEIKQ